MSDWPIGETFKFGEPGPNILDALLSQSNTYHDVREIGNGVYEHTFTPVNDWPFSPAMLVDEFEKFVMRDLSSAIRRGMKQIRKDERKKKIKRRQRRAAFRRWKRGLA